MNSYFIDKVKRAPAYAKQVFNKHYGDWLINHKKFKKISYSPADMFFLQVKDGEFRRPDMIVRHLAIDNYYGNNDFGFDMYRKLQDARVKKGYAEEAVRKFYALIESYAKNGYDPDSYILADKELKLRDGSHRMAMATYLNLPEITVAVFNATTSLVLDYKWLLANGFSQDEVCLLQNKADSLRKDMNVPLKCIVPCSDNCDDVIAAIKKYGNVLNCSEIVLSAEQNAELSAFSGRKFSESKCCIIDFMLSEPEYLPLKFAHQPQFVQTSAIKTSLGTTASKIIIPANFRENTKITDILK